MKSVIVRRALIIKDLKEVVTLSAVEGFFHVASNYQ
jgi:hypothetical protein